MTHLCRNTAFQSLKSSLSIVIFRSSILITTLTQQVERTHSLLNLIIHLGCTPAFSLYQNPSLFHIPSPRSDNFALKQCHSNTKSISIFPLIFYLTLLDYVFFCIYIFSLRKYYTLLVDSVRISSVSRLNTSYSCTSKSLSIQFLFAIFFRVM